MSFGPLRPVKFLQTVSREMFWLPWLACSLDPFVEVFDELVAFRVELLRAILLHDSQGITVVVGGTGELVGFGPLGDVADLHDAVDDLDRLGVIERGRGVKLDLFRDVHAVEDVADERGEDRQ